MPSIKRNSRTNLILDREQKGGKEKESGRKVGEKKKWETFVKNRTDQNFTVGICRCLVAGHERREGGPVSTGSLESANGHA